MMKFWKASPSGEGHKRKRGVCGRQPTLEFSECPCLIKLLQFVRSGGFRASEEDGCSWGENPIMWREALLRI